jgi:hypothetical protein
MNHNSSLSIQQVTEEAHVIDRMFNNSERAKCLSLPVHYNIVHIAKELSKPER